MHPYSVCPEFGLDFVLSRQILGQENGKIRRMYLVLARYTADPAKLNEDGKVPITMSANDTEHWPHHIWEFVHI
jgi:hypothetical protein